MVKAPIQTRLSHCNYFWVSNLQRAFFNPHLVITHSIQGLKRKRTIMNEMWTAFHGKCFKSFRKAFVSAPVIKHLENIKVFLTRFKEQPTEAYHRCKGDVGSDKWLRLLQDLHFGQSITKYKEQVYVIRLKKIHLLKHVRFREKFETFKTIRNQYKLTYGKTIKQTRPG